MYFSFLFNYMNWVLFDGLNDDDFTLGYIINIYLV